MFKSRPTIGRMPKCNRRSFKRIARLHNPVNNRVVQVLAVGPLWVVIRTR